MQEFTEQETVILGLMVNHGWAVPKLVEMAKYEGLNQDDVDQALRSMERKGYFITQSGGRGNHVLVILGETKEFKEMLSQLR